MGLMMSMKDIEQTASDLGDMLDAGVPLAQALDQMAELDPKRKAFWMESAEHARGGGRIGSRMAEVWPPVFSEAVNAGDEAGNMPEIMSEIARQARLNMQISSSLKGLIYPAFLAGFGLLVVLGFLVFVIPITGESLSNMGTGRKAEPSDLLVFSFMVRDFVFEYWPALLLGITASVVALVFWLRARSTKVWLAQVADQIPGLGTAMRSLWFARWAHVISMLGRAGLDFRTQMSLSGGALPEHYGKTIEAFRDDVLRLGIPQAVAAEDVAEDDLRARFPFLVRNAMVTGDLTGNMDEMLRRAADKLESGGFKRLGKIIKLMNMLAMLFAIVVISIPVMLHYGEMINQMMNAMSNLG